MPRKTAIFQVMVLPILQASMRPRPDAAENVHARHFLRPGHTASMRPRPDAAENADPSPAPRCRAACFNEAAARCRGKRRNPDTGHWRKTGFNEAAARCRGKQLRPGEQGGAAQVASMRPRPDAAENGHARCGGRVRQPHASMRPRPDAAENVLRGRALVRRLRASMRPRPDAAENAASRR